MGLASLYIATSQPVLYQEYEPAITSYIERAITPEGNAQLIKKLTLDSGLNDSDANSLVAIARCESHLRHFDEKTGEVLRGKVNPLDSGIFQLNKKYHLDTAIKLGLDIDNKVDNIKYAIWLYQTQGTTPWNWSAECWRDK